MSDPNNSAAEQLQDALRNLYSNMERRRTDATSAAAVAHQANPQRTYSHFAKLDTWLVRAEAIPLVFDVHPKSIEYQQGLSGDSAVSLQQMINRARGHALEVIEHDKHFNKWRVIPGEFLAWCRTKGIQAPDGLVAAVSSSSAPAATKELAYLNPGLETLRDVMRECWAPYLAEPDKVAKPKKDTLFEAAREISKRYYAEPITGNQLEHIIALVRSEEERKGGLTKLKG